MRPTPLQLALQQAIAHHQAGRFAAAYALYQQVQRKGPALFDGWHLGGLAALQLGRLEESVSHLERARVLQPKSAVCHMRLGVARRMRGELAQAEQVLRRAAELDPRLPESWEHLAVVYDLSGRLPQALEAAQVAARLKPDDQAAFSRVAQLLGRMQGWATALPLLQEAVVRWPRVADTWKDLGTVQACLHEAEAALVSLDRALALEPGFTAARLGRALALQESFCIPEAVAEYEEVLRAEPAHPEAGSARLLCLNYLDTVTAEVLRDAHFGYGRAQVAGLPVPPVGRAPVLADGRPLRVAVVSGDFRRHAVASFFEPLLAHPRAAGIEVWLYHDHAVVDEVSRRLQGLASQWRHMGGLANGAVEALLRSDAPDVLIDLAGHTGLNRLPLYARRVAPVQIAYLGYPNTTGLAAMDYRFTDAFADPVGQTDAYYTEQLIRYAPCAWTYQPPADAPAPALPPCASGAPVTFGSFNNPAKLNGQTLRLWARVLQAVPGSRLLLKGHGFDGTGLREQLAARFAAVGVERSRLEMMDRTRSSQAHLELYARVDVALDPYPYHGTTTTCEALWMGRPLVTLAGDEHRSRVGVSLLNACGHPEWIAATESDYVKIAADLARNPEGLTTLAQGLRSHLTAGPLLGHADQAARFWGAVAACAHGTPTAVTHG
jgi:predicted O-linked N-acetylglucosamine transferase (SPINDLY family)